MAANSQQLGAQMDDTPRKVNEVIISNLECQAFDLTFLVRQMAIGNLQVAKPCGICSSPRHYTDLCRLCKKMILFSKPMLRKLSGPPQHKYDPYSNSYNLD
ncbi:hypothetical protein PTKIN_Ptkin19aG0007200 [Pterospermum kingtungense]